MSSQRKNISLIFLTGFMGSGKSTVGPILANTLGYNFLDIDKIVEEHAQKPIPEIFRSEGEHAFRTMEHNALHDIGRLSNCVIALGGGTIANEENLTLVANTGILIYLKISPQQAMLRVQHHRTDRPMLKDDEGQPLAGEQLEQRIADLLYRREHFYSQADIIVGTDDLRVGMTVDEIVKKLRMFS